MSHTIGSLRSELSRHRYIRARVVTGSMAPLIRIGDEIVIEPIAKLSSLAKFDIVVFWDGEKPVCHYVLGHSSFAVEGEPTLLTMGLASAELDRPVRESLILGRVGLQMPLYYKIRETYRVWRILASS